MKLLQNKTPKDERVCDLGSGSELLPLKQMQRIYEMEYSSELWKDWFLTMLLPRRIKNPMLQACIIT